MIDCGRRLSPRMLIFGIGPPCSFVLSASTITHGPFQFDIDNNTITPANGPWEIKSQSIQICCVLLHVHESLSVVTPCFSLRDDSYIAQHLDVSLTSLFYFLFSLLLLFFFFIYSNISLAFGPIL